MIDRTTGSVVGHLVRTSGLALATLLFQALYLLIDLYWVSLLGTDAVAAVGVSANLMFLVLGATQMLGIGTTALVAQAVGRRALDEASLLLNQALGLAIVAGTVFVSLVLMLRGTYVRMLAADANISALAEAYLTWFLPAMGLQFCSVVLGSALRGSGVLRPVVIVQVASVAANVILAPIFMFGWLGAPRLGVVGAAVATLIAIATAVTGLVGFLVRHGHTGHTLRLQLADWKPRLAVWRRILALGLPASIELALTPLGLMFVYAITRQFGASAQAGFGIGQRILQISGLPVLALGLAIIPIAGQNVGAGEGERVRSTVHTAVLLSTVAMTGLAVVLWLSGDLFLRFFSADADVLNAGREFVVIAAPSLVPLGYIAVSSATFQALGNTMPILVTAVLRLFLVALPALWLSMRPGFSLALLWYISVAAVLVHAGLNGWLLAAEFRKRFPTTAEKAVWRAAE